jgi:hypothetical protein
VVSFTFNSPLDAIAGSANLTDTLLEVLQWVESRDRIPDLLSGARSLNPDNAALRAFVVALAVGPPDPVPASAPRADTNPFYGSSSYPVGREDELRRIWSKLRAGNHCSLIGPPGSGKTLLLKTLQAQAAEQLGWTASQWLLIAFRTINLLRELQLEVVTGLGGTRIADLRTLLRSTPLRALALDDLGWMGAGNEGLKMRRWLRGFAEDNGVQLVITSNKPLDVLFRADDPTVDSPFENLDKLPVQLGPLAPAACRRIVEARLTGRSYTVADFTAIVMDPHQPKELLNLGAERYEELVGPTP